MTAYEMVKGRLDARKKETPISCEEANAILSCSDVSIYSYKGKYMWFSIMCECDGFVTPEEALNDAIEYLKNDGY